MNSTSFAYPTFSSEQKKLSRQLRITPEDYLVVKVGGEILLHQEHARRLVTDLLLLHSGGARIILCHGGGPQLSDKMKKEGLTPSFRDGHRVTDQEMIDLTASVFTGEINRKLVTLINTLTPCGIGINGIDRHFLQVKQRQPELGFVGDITGVDRDFLNSLMSPGWLPVVAPLGVDKDGHVYNVNADMVAAHIAAALKARALILTTNVDGILQDKDDPTSLLQSIPASDLSTLFERGIISEGMLPKTDAASIAIRGNVSEVHIVNGFTPLAIPLSLSSQSSTGTIIS